VEALVDHRADDAVALPGGDQIGEFAAFAVEVLEPGGFFLAKVFQGGSEKTMLDLLKQNFDTVRHVKPPASRSDSAELYVLATGFRGVAG
jgi:23S rRNA (uridine2552-2'-O)-methyltransferase